MITSHWILLRTTNVSDKRCRENRNKIWCSIIFLSEDCTVYERGHMSIRYANTHTHHTHTHHTHTHRICSKSKLSHYRPGDEVRLAAFRESRHMTVVRLSVLPTGRLYPQEILLVITCVRGWVDSSAIVRPEVLNQWKIQKWLPRE